MWPYSTDSPLQRAGPSTSSSHVQIGPPHIQVFLQSIPSSAASAARLPEPLLRGFLLNQSPNAL